MEDKNFFSALEKYFRLANFLTFGQIYLQDNFLRERPLKPEDIKPRLLGHWGTCPGINFVYACLNGLIRKTKAETIFVLGTGHGFPALQANLFLEGTLQKFYPEASVNAKGIEYVCKNFSWPYGFPSHSNPGTPGVILEGGELGYSLSTAFGAVLDNPDLTAVCLIGDGEAETGPLAAAWHLNKLVHPKNNGSVLPILHLNGYKISGPTVFGRMSEEELVDLFSGYGYRPFFVSGDDFSVFEKMYSVLEQCYAEIFEIRKKARTGQGVSAFKTPMIILKTPKGWTGIKELKGEKIEGNFLSHQVVAKDAKNDPLELSALDQWFDSYGIKELFDFEKGLNPEIVSVLPDPELRMGAIKYAYADKIRKDLSLPNLVDFFEGMKERGEIGSSSMRRIGLYLEKVFSLNESEKNFRLMSPDETYSNKLDDVFKSTKRAFAWPLESWDKDFSNDGRVMEILSEHSLQGLMQGYVLTGRHGVFASYEAFVEIVSSMADQYAKFLKISREIPWRGEVSSFNYILTSSGWRQEHNGFSHQNPGFISGMIQKNGEFVRAYFPSDAALALMAIDKCLKSKNRINVMAVGKTLEPRWLSLEEAKKESESGIMIWDFASDENPDIVFSGIGDYMTKECLAAISYLRNRAEKIKIRFVDVFEISEKGLGNAEYRAIHPEENFNHYFTPDKPVIFNFHGYPETLQSLIFEDSKNSDRFSFHGYIENGSTTTPFDMQVRNKTSRFHLVLEALKIASEKGIVEKEKAASLISEFEEKLKEHDAYIRKFGVDMPEVENWVWKKNV